MHRFCICGHKEKAHNDFGICGVCECVRVVPKSATKDRPKYRRRTPDESRRVMGNSRFVHIVGAA